VYAAGATLYALLTGHVPPESIDLMGGMAKLTPPRAFSPRMSPNVEVAILRAMNTQPSTRYADAGQMLMALSAYHTPRPVKAMPMKAGRQHGYFRQRFNTRWLTSRVLFVFGTASFILCVLSFFFSFSYSSNDAAAFGALACLLYIGSWGLSRNNLILDIGPALRWLHVVSDRHQI